MIQFDEFVKEILTKRNGGPGVHPENEPLWTIGLVEEAGEVAGVIKKELYHGHPRNDGKFLSECGDVIFYLICMLHDRGYRLDDAMLANVQKLRKRYPDGFSKEASINRKD